MEGAMEIVWAVLTRAWAVVGEMSPWVLGGFGVAGALSLWLNPGVVRAHFGGGRRGAILKAVALGIPLPVCSCGVIPLGASLRRHGAGKGATAAFLMSTPQTGVDSIAVTYGLLGGMFAVLRPLAALVSGVACGLAVEAVEGGGGAAAAAAPEEDEAEARPWWARALRNGFIVLPRSVGGALLVGALVSAVVMTLVPENTIAEKIGSPLLQIVLTMAFGIPVYICSTAAVPFALGLMAAGLSPGAAMAFLIGGPGVSASTVLAVWRLMGPRAATTYVLVLVLCAIGFGLLVQALVPAGWVPPGARMGAPHVHGAGGGIAWGVHAQALVLLAVVAWAKWGPRGKPAAGLASAREN